MESRVFSTETLQAGMATLANQQVKYEPPEDKEAMLRELQQDFKGGSNGGNIKLFGYSHIARNLFGEKHHRMSIYDMLTNQFVCSCSGSQHS